MQVFNVLTAVVGVQTTVFDLISTLGYSILGIVIMVATVVFLNLIFGLNVRKELVEDNNVAFGVLIGGFAIAVSIIIAAVIGS